jgi:ADP-ribose pyrophosphatase
VRRNVPQLERRTIVFNGRLIRVEQDVVRLPHGRRTSMEIVRHRGSVVLVPQPDRDHVILIRQYRYAISRWMWELPAGSLDEGEAPARAARRECAEEIGLIPRTIRRLGVFFPTPGFCDERMVFFQCTNLVRPARPVAADEDEQIEPRTMSLADARRLVARGKIIDMKTVLGLVLVERARRLP